MFKPLRYARRQLTGSLTNNGKLHISTTIIDVRLLEKNHTEKKEGKSSHLTLQAKNLDEKKSVFPFQSG